MKRVIAVLTVTVIGLVLSAAPAIAGGNYPINPPTPGRTYGGGSTAFTGGSGISTATIVAVVLLITGITALIVARRRGTRGQA
jgi:hypothetical protein